MISYKTPAFVEKKGVVLTRGQVPYDSALTFNAGISRYQDGYVMLFRNDYGFCKQDFDDFYAGISDNTTPKTNLGAAFSKDGINWEVAPESNKVGFFQQIVQIKSTSQQIIEPGIIHKIPAINIKVFFVSIPLQIL